MKMSFSAKDLLALSKEIKIKEKLEKHKEKLKTIKLANELRISNENKKIEDLIFYETIASKCINAALNKKFSCEFESQELTPYEALILRSGFSLCDQGSFSTQQVIINFPDLINKNNRDVIDKDSPWSSLNELNKIVVISIEWTKSNPKSYSSIYPGFDSNILKNISSVENHNFNTTLELIWKYIQNGKKKISLLIEEYKDGQCTDDKISGVYFNNQMTALDELQIEGIFKCLGYQSVFKELKITNKDPENLIRKIELNISWL